MKRLAALSMFLLVFSGPVPTAGAEGTTVVWDSDRVIASVLTVEENDTLRVSAGVNIGFEPDESGQPGGRDTRPILAVLGRLVLDGTYGEPVRLAANESLWRSGGEPDCLYIYSDGRPDRFFARNASFTDIIINIGGSGGRFRDCRFERCDVLLASSAVSFENCSFIYSTIGPSELPGKQGWPSGVTVEACRFEGRGAASHPPIPYGIGGYLNEENYLRTAIEVRRGASVEGCTISGFRVGLVLGPGSSTVRNSTVRDCGFGMMLEALFPGDTAGVQCCTVLNCSRFGLVATGRLTLTGSVVGECGGPGVYADGDLLMANCTVSGCPTGVSLGAMSPGALPDRLLTGNRFFGCAGYAVTAQWPEVDLSGNRFDNGTASNGEGRLKVTRAVRLSVFDPWGLVAPGALDLAWTDSSGATGGQSFESGNAITLTQYTLDNDGVRTDRFPYELRVRKGTIENRTALTAVQQAITVVLPILPDLVPVELATDPDSLRPGQDARFLVRAENRGASPVGPSTVVFLVDGREVGRGRVPWTPIRGTSSVCSDPWRATPGRHTLEARLDAPGFIRENDETNNDISIQFNVSGASPPDPQELSRGRYYLALTMVGMVVAMVAVAAAWTVRRRRRLERQGPKQK